VSTLNVKAICGHENVPTESVPKMAVLGLNIKDRHRGPPKGTSFAGTTFLTYFA